MHMNINSIAVRDFCTRHGYFTCGTVERYRKMLDACDWDVTVDGLAHMIWLNSDEDLFETGFYTRPIEKIKAEILDELSIEGMEAAAASFSAAAHPDLVERIIEVSRWSPIITQDVTRDNCVLLETFGYGDSIKNVAFRVNGHGFSIDFESHTASRNTSYDL